MNRIQTLASVALLLVASLSHAGTGDFDRNDEVQRYLEIVQTGDRHELIAAARAIYISGISDGRLAAAMNERLLRDYPALWEQDRVRVMGPIVAVVNRYDSDGDGEYGLWMVRALASFGLPEYAATLQQIAKSPKLRAKSQRIRHTAVQEGKLIEWHKQKNEFMVSHRNQSDDDSQTSRLVSLLSSGDQTYQEFVLDQVYENKIRDPRILNLLSQQVTDYVDQLGTRPVERKENHLIAMSLKVIGASADKTYTPTLEKVLASNAVPGIKRHATAALNRLQAWSDRDPD